MNDFTKPPNERRAEEAARQWQRERRLADLDDTAALFAPQDREDEAERSESAAWCIEGMLDEVRERDEAEAADLAEQDLDAKEFGDDENDEIGI